MKEFIDKLKSRLEEEKFDIDNCRYDVDLNTTIDLTIKIINELAEEYKKKQQRYIVRSTKSVEELKKTLNSLYGTFECKSYIDTDILNFELEPIPCGWIPVSERLPEIGQMVLASIKKEIVADRFYNSTDYQVIITRYNKEMWWTREYVEAWMPLPAPYTEGE